MTNKTSTIISNSTSLLLILIIIWANSGGLLKPVNHPENSLREEVVTQKNDQIESEKELQHFFEKPLMLPSPPNLNSVVEDIPGKVKGLHGIAPLKPIETKNAPEPVKLKKILKVQSFIPAKKEKTAINPMQPARTFKSFKPGQSSMHSSHASQPIQPQQRRVEINAPGGTEFKKNVEQTSAIQSLSKGRVMLRILEHGTGPDIKFSWPNNQRARNSLFAILRKCYGMQVALTGHNKRLYRLSDPPGKTWDLSLDLVSGFSRLAVGKLADNEKNIIDRIERRHSLVKPGIPVRLFPRDFDGGLLGGLSRFINESNRPLRSISARYKRNGFRVLIEDIRINGQPVSGTVDLSPYASCIEIRRSV